MTAQQYKITTIADILALTPDQRVKCVADMAGWVEAVNMQEAILGDILKSEDHVVWVDDDLPPGTLSAIHINIKPLC